MEAIEARNLRVGNASIIIIMFMLTCNEITVLFT